MKKNYLLIGCLVFPILAVIAFFIGLNRPVRNVAYSKPVKSDSWLQISPTGIIEDYNEVNRSFMANTTSVQDICTKINDAAFDKNIKGILLQPSFIQIRTAGINEIGEAIKAFKQTGKPVIAHLEMQSQQDYMLAVLADTIAMEPSSAAGMFFEGVQANISFYKNLLDKLGLKINVIKSGEYKGAGETYSQTSLSPETYGNLKEVLSDRYELIISYIADHRNLSTDQVRAVFDKRDEYLLSADYALQSGLIDKVIGKDEFLKQYGITKKQLLPVTSYSPATKAPAGKDKIAVCYLQGGISQKVMSYMPEGINADKVQGIIDQINQDSKVKAVVLRVNSPGGSALESEIIYRKLEELKSRVPIVVSMSGVAASGGYYISAPSDYIVADPFTVTGSIGVVQLLPDASGLSKKVGITNQTIAFGKYAGSMNLMNTPSQELVASLQRNSANIYKEFKQRVVKYRKIDIDSLEALAGGRVWSAQDALDKRLIDQVGTLSDAIMKAAELAKLTSYQTVVLPQKRQYWELLFEQLNNSQMAKSEMSLETISDLIVSQVRNIFKPYSVLCLMPFELE
jgi:protease-4